MNAQTLARTMSVTARWSHTRRLVASAIAAPRTAPGDAQRIGDHAGRMSGEANRGVLVVYEPQRLPVHSIPGLLGAQEQLDLEREAGGLQLAVQRLRDRSPVSLVATLRVVVGQPAQTLHEEREDGARQPAKRRHDRFAL